MRFFLFCFSMICILSTQAQNGFLKGKLTDKSDGSELIGATVKIKDNPAGTVTDLDGNYRLELFKGTYTIEFSYIGYKTTTRDVVINPSETTTLNLAMADAAAEIGITVVSGGKYEKDIGEEIATIEVLQAAVIENTNASIDEAMNKVPGVSMVGETPSIRGGSSFSAGAFSRVLVMVDDMPMLSPENGAVRWDAMPTDNVQQVEVLKGASSVLYGSSALNGVINIRTANPKAEPLTKLTLSYGTYSLPRDERQARFLYDTVFDADGNVARNDDGSRVLGKFNRPMFGGIRFVHTKKFDKFDLAFAGKYEQDQGYQQNAAQRRANANLKLRHVSKRIEGLSVGGALNLTSTDGQFFFLWKNDTMRLTPAEVSDEQLRYVTIDPFVTYFDKYDNKHSLKTRFIDALYRTSTETNYTKSFYTDYLFSKRYSAIDLTLSAGATYSHTRTDGVTNGQHQGNNVGVYGQLEKKFFGRLSVMGGMRLEYFNVDSIQTNSDIFLFGEKIISDSRIKPVARFGLNYQVAEGTYLRGSAGMGYRFPTIAEFFVNTKRSGAIAIGNDSLQAETAVNYEIGLKQGLKFGNWLGYADVAVFLTEYDNLIEQVNQGNITFKAQNVDNARIPGVEVSTFAQGKIGDVDLSILAGYTYIYPRNGNYDEELGDTVDAFSGFSNRELLNYRSRHNAKIDIDGSWKDMTFGVSMIYNGFMDNIDPSIEAFRDGVAQIRAENPIGSFIFDARAGYNLNDHFKFNLVVKNITNESYILRPAFLEAPRNFTIQAIYTI